jgi:hypothetical protein
MLHVEVVENNSACEDSLRIMLHFEVAENKLHCIFRLLSKLCYKLRLLKIIVHVEVF